MCFNRAADSGAELLDLAGDTPMVAPQHTLGFTAGLVGERS